jgi:peptidyl-prolyl cis-trans isomerase B (cyclophilin B)
MRLIRKYGGGFALLLLFAGCVSSPQKPTETAPATHLEKNKKENQVMILMKTSKGDIKLELDREKAPQTVDNFLAYLKAGHYNGTIFHRVIDGFMIQGGGFDPQMHQKPAPRTVKNEADNGLSNERGTIAMARTPDPDSASAQFFINVKDNAFLNHTSKTPQGWGYCVFGRVVEGMDVVDAIKSVPTGSAKGFQDVPKDPVLIEEIILLDE